MNKIEQRITCVSHLKYPIVAFDFDNTIALTPNYPDVLAVFIEAIDTIKTYQKLGGKAILWTCRTGEHLQMAVNICKQFGITFDAVNENLEENIISFQAIFPEVPADSRKIFANLYVDDKNYFDYKVPWDEIKKEITKTAL